MPRGFKRPSPLAAHFEDAHRNSRESCHRDTDTLAQLVRSLYADGNRPKAVYMNVDYIYNTAYSVDVLKRNKQLLNALGVDFGLNIVNQCDNVSGTSAVNTNANFSALHCVDRSGVAENLVNEESMLNLVDFIKRQGILDAGTPLRMRSWSKRPVGQAIYVNEGLSG